MMTERLSCHISGSRTDCLPEDDAHPLWVELDKLAETVAACREAPMLNLSGISRTAMNGSLMCISSDTPDNVYYFWIELPGEPELRAQWVSICLDHLTRARIAFPGADWEVRVGEQPIGWSQEEFRKDVS
jgi:hypothetical protein